jgi:hypothetical protein
MLNYIARIRFQRCNSQCMNHQHNKFPPYKSKIKLDALMETVFYVTPPRVLHSRLINDHFIAKLLSIYNRLTSMILHFSRNTGGTI